MDILRTFSVVVAFLALVIAAPQASAATAYDFEFDSIDGESLPFSTYEGKSVLVVNVASYCGYTPQYEALQSLWETYQDQGLVVLGVPSNDFGNQEPGSNEEIKEFCDINYSINFPMTDKYVVKGDEAHPFYQWARESFGETAEPGWNFHKILVGPDGTVSAAFESKVTPESDELIDAVTASLPVAE